MWSRDEIRRLKLKKQMRTLLLIMLPSLLIGWACSEREKPLGDLNLYFDSEIEIDSILVTNITQDREFHFFKYANAINVDLNDSINDLYAIHFFAGNEHRVTQLWLNGEKLIIKGTVSNKTKIQIDTVVGSDAYYKSLHFRQAYKDMLADKPDSSVINEFLLTELRKEINSPFSIEIADAFVGRNISKTEELRKLFAILSTQNDLIREHLFNPYHKVETILSVDKIDFSKYRFYDMDKTLTSISLSGDKRYLIDFWFIGCPPCIQDHKLITKKLSAFDRMNVEVIGISIDDSQDQWSNFLDEKRYPWKNYRESDEHERRMRTDMMINVFPTYFLLDSSGTILHRSHTFSAVETYLGV